MSILERFILLFKKAGVVIAFIFGIIVFWYLYTIPALILDIYLYNDYYHKVQDFMDILAYTIKSTFLWIPIFWCIYLIYWLITGKRFI